MAEIGDKVAAFWARDMQTLLLAQLSGAFAAANMTGNVHDIDAQAGALGIFSSETYIDAVQKLGDHKDSVSAVMVHSAVEAHLNKQDLIETVRDSEGNLVLRQFMGHEVIVDDSLTPNAGVYDSYIFGPGAIGYGDGGAPVPTETGRDILAGDEILVNRRHFVLHPRGVKWIGTAAGSSPTNAEAATGTNWTRVYDPKLIRIVKFQYRIA
jgi:hypothetical protein